MSTNLVPNLVVDEITKAVESAIQFGVTPFEFLNVVHSAWSDEMRNKARREGEAFARALQSVGPV